MADDIQPEVIEGELCPLCNEKKLALRQAEREVPYFGMVFIFSMDCSGCGYHKADLEVESSGKPVKYTLEVDGEEDLKIRIVKSSHGSIKIPRIGSIEPGEAANGYVTNVEGVLSRIKHQVETFKENSDDKDEQKKAKNVIKKLNKILWGQEKVKMVLTDPTGNSAIVSDKAKKG